MDKGVYEIIKLLIQNVDQSIELTFVDGSTRTLPVNTDKLLDELDKAQKLEEKLVEKQAMIDWLANKIHRVYQQDWVPDCCVGKELSAAFWRKAAQDAVKKNV